MNDTIRQLMERKSVRSFTEQEIPEDIVQEILEASVNAPTAGNQQLYTILRITDHTLREKLAETCDHQPFIAKGQLLLVFCADCHKWLEAYRDCGCEARKPGTGDLLLAVDDSLIAAQNAVVAAQSYGIGSCYIGDIMENCEIHRDLLGLPDYVFPAALLVFGYPTPQQESRVKPERVKLEYIVHENRYRDLSADERREMFSPKAGDGSYEDWMRAFCRRKYNSDFAREMSRSVETYLEQYRL